MSTVVLSALGGGGHLVAERRRAVLGLSLVVIATAVQPFRGDTIGLLAAAGWVMLGASAGSRGHRRTAVPISVLLLVAWAALSVTWSSVATASAVGVAQMAVATLLAAHLASRLQLHEIVRGVAQALQCLLVASWIVGVALPRVGRTQDLYQSGSLEGVFVHRNILGYVGVLALLTFMAEWRRAGATGASRLSWSLWSLSALVTIVLTNSRTALVVLAAVIGLTATLSLIARLPAPLRRTAATGLMMLVLAGALGLARWGAALAVVVGRDATLTGRTDIWRGVESLIAQRPLAGYGWDALWHPSTQPSEDLWARVGFVFFHAHDGYLDIAAQLGLVGCALVACVIGVAVVRAGGLLLARPGGTSAWPLTICLCLLIFNLTESVLVVHVGWVLLVVLSTRLMIDARTVGRPHVGSAEPPPEQTEQLIATTRGTSWN